MLSEQLDARSGRVNAQLKSVKVESAVAGDDEFAIENALFRKLLAQRIKHLGKVSVEGLLVAALEKDFVAIAKDKDSETIPLGLVDPIAFNGNGVDALGQHGEEGWIHGEFHLREWMRRIARAVARGSPDRLVRIPKVWKIT